jgi:hypothetical protein
MTPRRYSQVFTNVPRAEAPILSIRTTVGRGLRGLQDVAERDVPGPPVQTSQVHVAGARPRDPFPRSLCPTSSCGPASGPSRFSPWASASSVEDQRPCSPALFAERTESIGAGMGKWLDESAEPDEIRAVRSRPGSRPRPAAGGGADYNQHLDIGLVVLELAPDGTVREGGGVDVHIERPRGPLDLVDQRRGHPRRAAGGSARLALVPEGRGV